MLRRIKKLLRSIDNEPETSRNRPLPGVRGNRPRPPEPRRPLSTGISPNISDDPFEDLDAQLDFPEGNTSLTDAIATDPDLELRLLDDAETSGPGKNVLAERPLYRLESGTYDTLKIVDGGDQDHHHDAVDAEGVDPYNTGSFDPPNRWDKSTLK